MTQVFIAFAQQDKPIAEKIAYALTHAGFTPWLDMQEAWKETINKAIQDASCVIALLSPSAKQAHYLEYQIGFATGLGKKIFPVLIEGDVENSTPSQMGAMHYLDARSNTDYDLLISTIREHIKPHSDLKKITTTTTAAAIAKALAKRQTLKIFISYQRDNQPIVERLVAHLQNMGHKVWYDQQLIEGHKWWDSILAEIRECDLCITALSPTYLDSQACRLEYEYAHDLNKRILPIEIVSVGAYYQLPIQLQAYQIVKLLTIDETSETKLNDVFDKLDKPAPPPKRLPKAPEMPVHQLTLLKDQAEAKQLGDNDAQLLLIAKLENYLFGENANDRDLARKILVNLKKRKDILYANGEKITRLLKQSEVE